MAVLQGLNFQVLREVTIFFRRHYKWSRELPPAFGRLFKVAQAIKVLAVFLECKPASESEDVAMKHTDCTV